MTKDNKSYADLKVQIKEFEDVLEAEQKVKFHSLLATFRDRAQATLDGQSKVFNDAYRLLDELT